MWFLCCQNQLLLKEKQTKYLKLNKYFHWILIQKNSSLFPLHFAQVKKLDGSQLRFEMFIFPLNQYQQVMEAPLSQSHPKNKKKTKKKNGQASFQFYLYNQQLLRLFSCLLPKPIMLKWMQFSQEYLSTEITFDICITGHLR